MVRSCSLKNCSNSVKQKYRFFLLPSVKKVAKRTAWLRKCGHLLPENLPTSGNSISLCEGHFEPDQFVEYGPNIRTILKPTAVPTIFTKNPPRVCDAVEKKYKKVLERCGTNNDTVVNKLLINQLISDDLPTISTINCTTNNNINNNDINNDSIDNAYTDASIPLENSVNTSTPLDLHLSQVEQELLSLSEIISTEKNNSSPVKLLRIKKNCMLVSTPCGNKVVPAMEKKSMDQSNLFEKPNLSFKHDENSAKNINVNIKELPSIGISSVNNKSSSNNDELKIMRPEFSSVTSEQQILKPLKLNNIPNTIHIDEKNPMKKIKIMTKVSKKPLTFNLTQVTSNHDQVTPVALITAIQSDKIDLTQTAGPEIKLLNAESTNIVQAQSQCDGSDELNSIADEEINSDNNVYENSTDQKIFGSDEIDQTVDRRISIDGLDNIIEAEIASNKSNNDLLFYSPVYTDINTLRKRVHELEAERDYALRKYRRLAVKMEVFYKNLQLFLNDDQIRILETNSPTTNTIQWSADTLQRSAKIRSIIGPRGYEYLRTKEHFPLPSFRTLYRHRNISKLNEYNDGMLHEHISDTINNVATIGIDELEASDDDIEVEKVIIPEHIKVEMLEDECFVGQSIEEHEIARVNELNRRITENQNFLQIIDKDVDTSDVNEDHDLSERIYENHNVKHDDNDDDISYMEVVEYVTVKSASDKDELIDS